MTCEYDLDILEIEIRRAVESGEFVRARQIFEVYAVRLQAALGCEPLPENRLADVRALWEWARQIARATRARTVEELNAIELRNSYLRQACGAFHTIAISA